MAEAKQGNMTDEEQKQYERLINARNFHYDNLNKWLITFYAIIGALFVAFYTLYSKEAKIEVEIVVAIVGYIVSIGAVLSGKGYSYWEVNWITLIHHFEKVYLAEYKADMRVYSVFANFSTNNNLLCPTSGANVSTTKVALAITVFVSYLWGVIVLFCGISLLPFSCINCPCWLWLKISISVAVSVILTHSLIWISGKRLKSYLKPLDELCLTDKNLDQALK